MRRRRFVVLASAAASLSAAGCAGGGGRGGTTTEPLDPGEVTTTGGDDVEILVAQIVIREEDAGPHVYYRLRNDGAGDATVEVRTVLRIEDGGTYEASGYTDVPGGGEVFIEYQLVEYDALPQTDREAVRRGNADFDTYVNGERRRV